MAKSDRLEKRVSDAIKLFWLTRDKQSESQGAKSGQKDAGLRAAVTGGKHLDGFTDVCRDLFIDAGVPEAHVYWRDKRELPGYYRAEKNWDLIVVADGHSLAVIEFKAQVGPSFGNNFNNRTEEALGNATNIWAAYREGAFKPSARPWLGYVFILEDCAKSVSAHLDHVCLGCGGVARQPAVAVVDRLGRARAVRIRRACRRWSIGHIRVVRRDPLAGLAVCLQACR